MMHVSRKPFFGRCNICKEFVGSGCYEWMHCICKGCNNCKLDKEKTVGGVRNPCKRRKFCGNCSCVAYKVDVHQLVCAPCGEEERKQTRSVKKSSNNKRSGPAREKNQSKQKV